LVQKPKTDPARFDLTHLCPACGYKIPPDELLRTEWNMIRCPKCSEETVYSTKKPLMTS
jgi:DNA-directed RNA polymerase subunit RPC12/RpoP